MKKERSEIMEDIDSIWVSIKSLIPYTIGLTTLVAILFGCYNLREYSKETDRIRESKSEAISLMIENRVFGYGSGYVDLSLTKEEEGLTDKAIKNIDGNPYKTIYLDALLDDAYYGELEREIDKKMSKMKFNNHVEEVVKHGMEYSSKIKSYIMYMNKLSGVEYKETNDKRIKYDKDGSGYVEYGDIDFKSDAIQTMNYKKAKVSISGYDFTRIAYNTLEVDKETKTYSKKGFEYSKGYIFEPEFKGRELTSLKIKVTE